MPWPRRDVQQHNFISAATRRLRINKQSSLRRLAGRICERRHCFVPPLLFPALEVPGSQEWSLGRNRKNSYPRYEPGSRQQQPNKWHRRKRLDLERVCFFLFVEFAPQSSHWREVSFCVCFPVGLAGKQTPKERRREKKNLDTGNIWIFTCA